MSEEALMSLEEIARQLEYGAGSRAFYSPNELHAFAHAIRAHIEGGCVGVRGISEALAWYGHDHVALKNSLRSLLDKHAPAKSVARVPDEELLGVAADLQAHFREKLHEERAAHEALQMRVEEAKAWLDPQYKHFKDCTCWRCKALMALEGRDTKPAPDPLVEARRLLEGHIARKEPIPIFEVALLLDLAIAERGK